MRGNGIGSELLGKTLAGLREVGASVLRSHARADWASRASFLDKLGFKEFMRERDWQLDVRQFDFACYQQLIESLESDGIACFHRLNSLCRHATSTNILSGV